MNQPYQAPNTDVSIASVGTYQPKFLSLSGRIGRMRYFAYGSGLTLLFYAVLGVLAAIMIPALQSQGASMLGIGLGIISVIGFVVLLVFTWGYMVRRLNDINASGWLSLLMLVPLVNVILGLVLLFKKGSEGSNDYGAAPTSNSVGVKAAFWIFLLLMVGYFGVVVPTAMTTYQQYVEKAQAAQQLN